MPAMRRVSLLTAVIVSGPAWAGVVETPQCRDGLPKASAAISRVSNRDRGPRPTGNAAICQTLRTNLSDMKIARDIMARCLTGHERGENIGQIDASMGDVAEAIRRRCN